MALVTLTPPDVEPVSLDDLRSYLRVDADDANDATLSFLAVAAREWVEAYLGKRLITQQVRLQLDFFPGVYDAKASSYSTPFLTGANAAMVGLRYALTLPLPPVQQIDAFRYVDASGNWQDLTANTDYFADLASRPARLMPPFGSVWPVARVVTNAVQVDYTVGYGATGATVPARIRASLLRLVAHWYENRLPDENDIPKGVRAALMSARDLRF